MLSTCTGLGDPGPTGILRELGPERPGLGSGILWGSTEPLGKHRASVERFQVRVCVFQECPGARMLCCSNVKAWEVFFPL